MGYSEYDPAAKHRRPWNVGRMVGAKRALKPQQVWAIRFWLDRERRLRDRAMMARFDSANAAYGESYLLLTILAGVLGGVSPKGGYGTVGGLVIALAILQLISTACILLDLSQTRAASGRVHRTLQAAISSGIRFLSNCFSCQFANIINFRAADSAIIHLLDLCNTRRMHRENSL